jgi:uncharacterized protein
VSNNGVPEEFTLKASDVILATGHSSRSIFQHLYDAGVCMTRKDFAVGLRLQISQRYVNRLQYGEGPEDLSQGDGEASSGTATGAVGRAKGSRSRRQENPSSALASLGPAEFTLKCADSETGRQVYTFCMCPGGVVVNASHGGEEVAVNGMSYSTRASRYANAAIVATVRAEDFDGYEPRSVCGGESRVGSDDHPLRGMYFQQYWEHQCYRAAGGAYSAPAQRVTDYLHHHYQADHSFSPDPTLPDSLFMGRLKYADLHQVLPASVNTAIANSLLRFARSMPQIVDPDTLLMGIESRTSSPVRIDRDEVTLESVNTEGLYPVGEGAGYAGGIMTACVDGVRAVEALIAKRTGRRVTGADVELCVAEQRRQQRSGGVSSW